MSKQVTFDELDENLFGIDKHNLDEEWTKQPGRVFKIAKLQADAERDLDYEKIDLELLEEELETTDAQLDILIRTNPDNYGLKKATEASISNLVKLQPEHRKAFLKIDKMKRQIADTKHQVGIFKAAMHSLDNKKKGLESNVQLWSQSYFADPKTSGAANHKMMDELESHKAFNRKGHKDA